MKPETAEKLLVWILRGAGVVCTLAIVPMLMPIAWAQSAHAAIGLGELPVEPIVEYLVRGMSAMCALYGGLLLLLANDVHRYRRVITYQAIAILTIATCGTIIMHSLPDLGKYVLIDGISCWLYCVPILWLQTRLTRK
ncbi:MAG: hypothetical protein QF749_07020 [Verrucomicrobiota bacterium]|jgi:hypothetical protein|nr:hypothetical protein [Verrucomicrobiota bacterium]MDP6250934.1 hypothetical protein [Verrucomicrobiota bacterium]MDP7178031.1 hypothetical protein [Verrucomicrobiota bacterium]MDP7291927.1 hypothetical protein [Verrucomicrobiota bacterium]|tara:strand:- start:409 stop:822 length:414 start_codon:yes stop_codon:yes gene_type:complete